MVSRINFFSVTRKKHFPSYPQTGSSQWLPAPEPLDALLPCTASTHREVYSSTVLAENSRFSNWQTRTRLQAKKTLFGNRGNDRKDVPWSRKIRILQTISWADSWSPFGVRQSQGDSSIVFLSKETLVTPGMLLLSLLILRCPSRAKLLILLDEASAYGIGVLGSQVQTIL